MQALIELQGITEIEALGGAEKALFRPKTSAVFKQFQEIDQIRNCLILAAGNGRRMQPISNRGPKPMVPVCGTPLLEHIILSARQAGVKNFVVVVGYRGELIQKYFVNRQLAGVSLEWVENPDYHKENGISALSARGMFRDPFLLLMGDHLFQSWTARSLVQQPLHSDEVILAVDRKIDRVFDLDDATKVRLESNDVVDIGKQLPSYDALDTGMFLCTPALFGALESSVQNGDCSLSDGMRNLASRRRLRAFDIREGYWVDVDTPLALAHAESLLEHERSQPWHI
jgi:choline kinase